MPYSKEFYELDGEARINEILDDLSEAYYDLYLNKSLWYESIWIFGIY